MILWGGVAFAYVNRTTASATLYPATPRDMSNHGAGTLFTRDLGDKEYELNDHLGNVRVRFSDVKLSQNTAGTAPYKVDLRGYTNYYPFGMAEPGREMNIAGGRYGYNGKEMDNDWNNGTAVTGGEGNSYDYGFQTYDPRLGRFLSVDPLAAGYPWYTPYQYAGNTPIQAVDLDGGEPYFVNHDIRVELLYRAFLLTKIGRDFDQSCGMNGHSQGGPDIYLSTCIDAGVKDGNDFAPCAWTSIMYSGGAFKNIFLVNHLGERQMTGADDAEPDSRYMWRRNVPEFLSTVGPIDITRSMIPWRAVTYLVTLNVLDNSEGLNADLEFFDEYKWWWPVINYPDKVSDVSPKMLSRFRHHVLALAHEFIAHILLKKGSTGGQSDQEHKIFGQSAMVTGKEMNDFLQSKLSDYGIRSNSPAAYAFEQINSIPDYPLKQMMLELSASRRGKTYEPHRRLTPAISRNRAVEILGVLSHVPMVDTAQTRSVCPSTRCAASSSTFRGIVVLLWIVMGLLFGHLSLADAQSAVPGRCCGDSAGMSNAFQFLTHPGEDTLGDAIQPMAYSRWSFPVEVGLRTALSPAFTLKELDDAGVPHLVHRSIEIDGFGFGVGCRYSLLGGRRQPEASLMVMAGLERVKYVEDVSDALVAAVTTTPNDTFNIKVSGTSTTRLLCGDVRAMLMCLAPGACEGLYIEIGVDARYEITRMRSLKLTFPDSVVSLTGALNELYAPLMHALTSVSDRAGRGVVLTALAGLTYQVEVVYSQGMGSDRIPHPRYFWIEPYFKIAAGLNHFEGAGLVEQHAELGVRLCWPIGRLNAKENTDDDPDD